MNNSEPSVIRGIVDITRRGTGFVSHDDFTEDVMIEKDDLNTALNGDEVEVKIGPKRRGRVTGKVSAVLGRATTEFVGVVKKESASFYLKPDDQRCYVEFRIPEMPSDVAVGDKVIVRLTRWETSRVAPVAEFIRRLGKAGEHETETKANIFVHGFAVEFPEDVQKEADALAAARDITEDEIARRRDFRKVVTFTIDPEDAKDFDDALSVEVLEDGMYEVGVHIADVTHYVRLGTALDADARKRGTSVYLVDRTIPMLPEILSNDICSLKPNVDRLAFSAVFTVDASGHIHKRWFGRTVINSNTRFTYAAAQKVLDDGSGPHADELKILKKLADMMRKDRESRGAISFDTDEIKIALDDTGKPIRVYIKERLATMKMIEDWMLLANKEVPTHIAELAKKSHRADPRAGAFIYRIHDTPDQDRVEELRIFLKAVGYELGKEGTPVTSHDINKLLKAARGTPEEAVIQMSTLRSLAKAVYSHKNIGHFSLGFGMYTHFTSPIRRYPDMIAHRLLASHLNGEEMRADEVEGYQRAAITSSEREVAAVEAERDSLKYKQVEYMTTRIGSVFQGTITGVTENGVFVAEKETRAEGFIHISALSGDYYEFHQRKYSLVGKKNKRAFRLGDIIAIKLLSADVDTRRIDWALAE